MQQGLVWLVRTFAFWCWIPRWVQLATVLLLCCCGYNASSLHGNKLANVLLVLWCCICLIRLSLLAVVAEVLPPSNGILLANVLLLWLRCCLPLMGFCWPMCCCCGEGAASLQWDLAGQCAAAVAEVLSPSNGIKHARFRSRPKGF